MRHFKLEQAARQALLYLEAFAEGETVKPYESEEAITALREALAEQAEQEPVALGYFDADGLFMDALDRQHGAYQTKLYTRPVRTKDLTDNEIASIGSELAAKNCVSDIAFARVVIAADREKNK